jgi:hypothetical protein
MESQQGELLRCRTCDNVVARLEMRHDRLVGICERCADRTPLRCPSCGTALKADDRQARCARGHEWRIDGARLESPYGKTRARPSEGKYTFEKKRRVQKPMEPKRAPRKKAIETASYYEPPSLRIEEKIERTEVGYRDAQVEEVLELERPARQRMARQQPWWVLSLAIGLGLVPIVWASLSSQLPSVGRIALGLVGGFILLGLIVQRATAGKTQVPPAAIRVGKDEIERNEAGVWRRVAKVEDARSVAREIDDHGFYRLRVELEGDRSEVLLGDLEEEEAALAAARLNDRLRRGA